MKRNQRKYGAIKKGEKTGDQVNQNEIVEVLPPKNFRGEAKDPLRTNRCCNVSSAELNRSKDKKSDTLSLVDAVLLPKYKAKPDLPKTLQLRTHQSSVKIDKASQYRTPQRSLVYLMKNKSQCNVCDSADLDLSLQEHPVSTEKTKPVSSEKTKPLIDNIHITNKPRIKIIAEKFTKLKKNNLEVRQLEEKIVCAEYDVYDSAGRGFDSPAQTMRVYFSIKPNATKENIIDTLPSVIKKQFVTDNSRKFDTEIFILDEKINENKPYVEDLKVLKRKYGVKKKKDLFNLVSLYKMAKEGPVLDKNLSNIISSTKMEEFEKLIMDTTPSSLHGLCWRRVKNENETEKPERDGCFPQSLFAE